MKPEIGKEYHFWDDGKVSPSRHYICKIVDIISLEQAKDIMLEFTIQPSRKHTYFSRVMN